jgi:hypothetical protein
VSERAASVIAAARTMMGTPFLHQGRLPGVGLDCIGLIAVAALWAGVPNARAFLADPEFKGYARRPAPAMLYAACDKYLDRIDALAAGPADILLVRHRHDPQHFMLITGREPLYAIHANDSPTKPEVVENRVDERRFGRVLRAYRLRWNA